MDNATDQGDYEPDDSATIRIKLGQQFGVGSSTKGPTVVADKTDIVGKFCLPLYKYLTTNAPNPNDVSRITLNYEKFLLDADGNIVPTAGGNIVPPAGQQSGSVTPEIHYTKLS